MPDPRPPECQKFSIGPDGKVNGIELQYRELPDTKYQLVRCDFINEATAAGNTTARYDIYDKDGLPVEEKVWLAWAWPDLRDGWGLPGNPNHEHMIFNTFSPPNIGPLAMYPGDFAHNPIGDIIGGIGLPDHRHVCFHFVWKERGDEPPPPPPPPTGDLAALYAEVREMHGDLERLAEHLGLPI